MGQPYEWVVEVKMARLRGDNGKPDDTAIKDIISPYQSDRSALADCTKLANAEFNCRKAIVIYGFDYPDRPLDPVIATSICARYPTRPVGHAGKTPGDGRMLVGCPRGTELPKLGHEIGWCIDVECCADLRRAIGDE